MNLPLSLPYKGASTICNSDGLIIAECIDPEMAEAIVAMINAIAELVQASPECRSMVEWKLVQVWKEISK